MRIRIVVLMCLGMLAAEAALGTLGRKSTTRVVVKGIDGRPLEGMEVGISYPDYGGNNFVSGNGSTDSEGVYEFSGKAYREVFYTVRREGYYFTHGTASISKGKGQAMETLDSLEIQLVAKEIRNRIPMLATRNFRPILPPPGTRVGFDFFKNELVEPYGKGEKADVFFLITGEYEDRYNHNSLLTIEFPNEGDGLVEFEMDVKQGSVLESAHEAPVDGYELNKLTRKSVRTIKGLWPERPGHVEYERVNDVRENVGYYIRIRTELDEEGRIASAHYGKIYGDLDFFGAYPEGSYVTANAYYINPTAMDRNVEADTSSSLLDGIEEFDIPKTP